MFTWECPGCGKELDVDARHCPQCGKQFDEAEEADSSIPGAGSTASLEPPPAPKPTPPPVAPKPPSPEPAPLDATQPITASAWPAPPAPPSPEPPERERGSRATKHRAHPGIKTSAAANRTSFGLRYPRQTSRLGRRRVAGGDGRSGLPGPAGPVSSQVAIESRRSALDRFSWVSAQRRSATCKWPAFVRYTRTI